MPVVLYPSKKEVTHVKVPTSEFIEILEDDDVCEELD